MIASFARQLDRILKVANDGDMAASITMPIEGITGLGEVGRGYGGICRLQSFCAVKTKC